MKNFVLPIVLSVIALSSMASANADQQVQKPWTVQVGAGWPGQSSAKNFEGDTAWNAGVDYAFSKSNAVEPMLTSVYFDYTGASDHGNSLNTYGVGIGGRQYFGRSANMSPYYGAGVGVYDTDGKGGGNSKSQTNIGGKVLVGLQFTGAYFVQVGYNWLPSVKNVDPSNVGVDVGLRF